jgi:acetyl-CoA carboxylase biotin carboxyl carrier protein
MKPRAEAGELDETKQNIRALIRLFEESDLDELRVETSDLKLAISKNPDAPGLTVSENPAGTRVATTRESAKSVPPPPEPKKKFAVPEGMVTITAPNLGTFWRAPKPGADPYVEIGQKVNEETTVCLIEVMKLFTPISAGVSGTIVEMVAENSAMVEFGETLILVDPAK